MLLDTLPLTLNGKIDRRALPEPPARYDQMTHTAVAPRTPLEQEIASIFAEVLHVQQVTLLDNFFELVGDSLSAMQVVSRLRSHFHHDFALAQFFQAGSVRDIAQLIEVARSEREQAELAEVIKQVEQLSENDLMHMLMEKNIIVGDQFESKQR